MCNKQLTLAIYKACLAKDEPLLLKRPVDLEFPELFSVGNNPRYPINLIGVLNLDKSPHSLITAAIVLDETPGIVFKFSINELVGTSFSSLIPFFSRSANISSSKIDNSSW